MSTPLPEQNDVIRTNAEYKAKIDQLNKNNQAINHKLMYNREVLRKGALNTDRNLLLEYLSDPTTGTRSVWNLPMLRNATPWVRSYVNITVVGLVGLVAVRHFQTRYEASQGFEKTDGVVKSIGNVSYQKPQYADSTSPPSASQNDNL